MAAASEHLLKMMNKHPELKRLADNKEALRQALLGKGFTEEQVENMDSYPDLFKTLDFSIDQVIEQNGYTHNFGTEEEPETLSSTYASILNYHKSALESIEEYGNGAKNFYNDKNIEYLSAKPCVGSMSYFCCKADNLKYVPQMDWSRATNIYYCFTNVNTSSLYKHDTYTIDCSNLKQLSSLTINFTNELVLTNMRDDCDYHGAFEGTTKGSIQRLIGFNPTCKIREVYGSTNSSHRLEYIPHIEFAEGSIIKTANVIITDMKPTTQPTYWDYWDVETIYGMLEHAYDWKTNPRELAEPTDGYVDTVSPFYYDYRITDAAKARLEAAYPDVDFAKMMEDKGWTY